MDTHHPGDSGFWILGVGRMKGCPGWKGRRTLDSGYWILGSPSEVPGGRAAWILDSWILDTGRSEVPGGRAVGLWILDSGNWGPLCAREGRCRLDSGFLDSGFCSPPLGTAWILDSWILETARIQNPDARILDPGFWILDSAQRASAHA